jgi:WD40 repeat protein
MFKLSLPFTKFLFVTLNIVFVFLLSYSLAQAVSDKHCTAILPTSSYLEGSLLTTNIQADTRNLVLVDEFGNIRDLGSGYYNIQTFYNPTDQTALIWIRARNDQEEPRSDEPDTLELWSLVTNELIATTAVPSSYLPIQRIPDGKLIVFDWGERLFFTLHLMPGGELINNSVVAENELPDAIGVSLVSRSFAEFAFSPNLQYIAYKTSGLQLAIYDLWEKEEIWRSPEVPLGMEPMSHPVWNSTSDRLAAALFVKDEMQLFLIDPVSKMRIQLTHFPPDANYGQPGMIRPGYHLRNIRWSPNDHFLTFSQSDTGFHVLDLNSMRVARPCQKVGPMFWSGEGNQLFIAANEMEYSIYVLDLNTFEASPVLTEEVFMDSVIGWSPQTTGD